MKKTNVTAEYLQTKGAALVARSKKFDGACYMPSTVWLMPSGIAYHLITYTAPESARKGEIFSRLFTSSRRWQ